MPEPATRTTALLTGQVDWIESPSPDTIPRLEAGSMQVVTSVHPARLALHAQLHQGPVQESAGQAGRELTRSTGGIMVDLLGGIAIPEVRRRPAVGAPITATRSKYEYDPKKATRAAAGSRVPCRARSTIGISTSGSGLEDAAVPMNELVKSLARGGRDFKVTLQTMDWNALLSVLLAAAPRRSRYIDASSISQRLCARPGQRVSSRAGHADGPIGRRPSSGWGRISKAPRPRR